MRRQKKTGTRISVGNQWAGWGGGRTGLGVLRRSLPGVGRRVGHRPRGSSVPARCRGTAGGRRRPRGAVPFRGVGTVGRLRRCRRLLRHLGIRHHRGLAARAGRDGRDLAPGLLRPALSPDHPRRHGGHHRTVVLAYFLLGIGAGGRTATDGRWAAVFLANFHFTAVGTNYLAAQLPPRRCRTSGRCRSRSSSTSSTRPCSWSWPAIRTAAVAPGAAGRRPLSDLVASLAFSVVDTHAQRHRRLLLTLHPSLGARRSAALWRWERRGSRGCPTDVAAAGHLDRARRHHRGRRPPSTPRPPIPGPLVAIPVFGAALIIAGGVGARRLRGRRRSWASPRSGCSGSSPTRCICGTGRSSSSRRSTPGRPHCLWERTSGGMSWPSAPQRSPTSWWRTPFDMPVCCFESVGPASAWGSLWSPWLWGRSDCRPTCPVHRERLRGRLLPSHRELRLLRRHCTSWPLPPGSKPHPGISSPALRGDDGKFGRHRLPALIDGVSPRELTEQGPGVCLRRPGQ